MLFGTWLLCPQAAFQCCCLWKGSIPLPAEPLCSSGYLRAGDRVLAALPGGVTQKNNEFFFQFMGSGHPAVGHVPGRKGMCWRTSPSPAFPIACAIFSLPSPSTSGRSGFPPGTQTILIMIIGFWRKINMIFFGGRRQGSSTLTLFSLPFSLFQREKWTETILVLRCLPLSCSCLSPWDALGGWNKFQTLIKS